MSKFVPAAFAAMAMCGVAPAFGGVEVPEVSGPAFTVVNPGDQSRSRILKNGVEVLRTSKRVDANTIERSESDGCGYTVSADDLYAPNLTWSNCSLGPWGTGNAENIRKDGQLWPLKVGNVVHYKYTAINAEGRRNNSAFRSCEVTDKVMAAASGKDYPAYKVHCTEHTGTRTYYFAPAVAATVRMEQNHNKSGRSVMEFVERLP